MKCYIVKGNKTEVIYGFISEKKALDKLLDSIRFNWRLQWFVDELDISIEELLILDKFADMEEQIKNETR